MPRRISIICLFAAWLCASGAMLDVVQVFAWARMFTRYAQSMPVEEAAVETMDANKPCPICLAVRRARDNSAHEQPPGAVPAAEKLTLSLHRAEPVVFAPDREAWPRATSVVADSWPAPVPVPPPRTSSAVSML